MICVQCVWNVWKAFHLLAEMDEFVMELDEDVEMLQGTIYLLQQQLKESKEQLATLQKENQELRSSLAQVNTSCLVGSASCVTAADSVPRDSVEDSQPASHNSLTNSDRIRSPITLPTQLVSNDVDSAKPSKTTNGASHGNMETDLSDSQAEDEDTGHRQCSGQQQTNSNKLELNTHRTPSSSSPQNLPPSDSAEQTDGTSSESWSPQRAPACKAEQHMDQTDFHSSQRTEKSDGLRPIPNGALSPTPTYGSQGEEEDELWSCFSYNRQCLHQHSQCSLTTRLLPTSHCLHSVHIVLLYI